MRMPTCFPGRRSVFRWVFVLFQCGILLFTALAAARAQPTVPESPAGRTLAAWLDAFNSGERLRLENYRNTFDPTFTVDGMLAFRNQTGGFNLLGIEKSQRLRVEFMVQERIGGRRAVGKLEVTDADSPRVSSLVLRLVPPGSPVIGFDIDAQTRARVINAAVAKLNEFYVFPQTAKQMEQAVRAHLKRGKYDTVTDGDAFAGLLTADLQDVSHDKHLHVAFSPSRIPEISATPDADAMGQLRTVMQRVNCGFEKVEVLPNNVGYVKFNMFASPDICADTAIAAMNFLANSEVLIFDLRENGGGEPAMIALISTYLFSAPTHLNDLWERKSDTARQYWTLPFVPGKRLPTVPVHVLTSKRTFSGAEEFSNNLKALKRATIVGETTGGGAHPVSGHRIDDRFTIGVPYARAINPVTKTNWEGTGVEPDVKVPAMDALATAQKLAAERPPS